MGRCSQSQGVILCRIQPRSVIMSIRNHAFGHPPTDDTLTNLAKGAVAGGVELGEFVVDVDGDGADQPNPATGAGLGRMAGRAIQARRDQPTARLYRQPVPATLTTTSCHSAHQGPWAARNRHRSVSVSDLLRLSGRWFVLCRAAS